VDVRPKWVRVHSRQTVALSQLFWVTGPKAKAFLPQLPNHGSTYPDFKHAWTQIYRSITWPCGSRYVSSMTMDSEPHGPKDFFLNLRRPSVWQVSERQYCQWRTVRTWRQSANLHPPEYPDLVRDSATVSVRRGLATASITE
jgi:hypothetical protein